MKKKNLLHKHNLTLLLGLLLLFIIAVALIIEYIGYKPCNLCEKERIAYYIAIPLALISSILYYKYPQHHKKIDILIIIIAITLFINLLLSIYHLAIEFHWIDLPNSCVNKVNNINLNNNSLLVALYNSSPPASCDTVNLYILGLSLVSWNAIITIGALIGSIFIINLKK
ncbi:disulfide bond formation protein B [Bartonella sp. DGB1]|uniref:disulfide bond formation protein B n=1 Tax=Bartonella sp. DGB1 TaxID=3239807 RepID=UPI003524B459